MKGMEVREKIAALFCLTVIAIVAMIKIPDPVNIVINVMDKETLEKLLDGQPVSIRGQGVLLYNGAAKCAQEYQAAPTAANLRDWEAAQVVAIAAFISGGGGKRKEDGEKP